MIFINDIQYSPLECPTVRNTYGFVEIEDNTNYYIRPDGFLHNTKGPSIINSGRSCWYINGNLHREDGPAVEYTNGPKYWWIEGHRLSYQEFQRKVRNNKLEIINGKK